jgi:hypothetical protein
VSGTSDLLEFSVGDLGVIRLECSQDERFVSAIKVYEDGSALFKVLSGGQVRIWPNRESSMGGFTLIKHTPAAELQYMSRSHDPYETPRQAQIKAWLATRPRGE